MERNNLTIMPKVWEYVGGILGALPNRRGSADYTLQDLGFTFVSQVAEIPIFVRQQDTTPMGLIAIKTKDDCIIILDGEFDLESLLMHPNKFTDNPTIGNAPKCIETLHPEKIDIVRKLKNKKEQ